MLLMTEARTSTKAHIETLYQEHHRPVLAYLTKLVSDYEAAQELCQETFVKALRGWEKRDAQKNAVAWLYRIATNTAYDHLRRRRRIRFFPLIDNESSTAFGYGSESKLDVQEPVQQALAQLPASYRRALLLYSYEGRSNEEIAHTLGCSTSAIKTRLFRARERFRKAYAGLALQERHTDAVAVDHE